MILNSKSFQIENLSFTAFSVNMGDYIVINMPGELDFNIEKLLYDIFSGQQPKDEVLINEKIVPVIIPVQKYRVSFFSKLTAFNYLLKATSYAKEEIKEILKAYNIDPKSNIYKLGLNERMLLALEKSYSESKNIILNTSGLDYQGIKMVKERVAKELVKGSLIEINYRSSRGRDYLFDGEIASPKIIEVENIG